VGALKPWETMTRVAASMMADRLSWLYRGALFPVLQRVSYFAGFGTGMGSGVSGIVLGIIPMGTAAVDGNRRAVLRGHLPRDHAGIAEAVVSRHRLAKDQPPIARVVGATQPRAVMTQVK